MKKKSQKKRYQKGGYHEDIDPVSNQTTFTYYEGEDGDKEKILEKGKIGDLVNYATNNQLGTMFFKIVAGDEKDGKTLKQIGDMYGFFSNPDHPEYLSDSEDEGSKGGKRKTMKNKKKKKKKKKTKKRKWSMKYKKSINCKRPKGFSQKQYCKFGRKKKGGRENFTQYSQNELIDMINDDRTSLDQLKNIINDLNTIETDEQLTRTSKAGFMALKKYNLRTSYESELYNWLENQADSLISESSQDDPVEGVVYENLPSTFGSFWSQFDVGAVRPEYAIDVN